MRISFFIAVASLIISCSPNPKARNSTTNEHERKADSLLNLLSLEEKIGQMNQRNDGVSDSVILSGEVGSVLNCVDLNSINRMQKIAVEHSKHGIPLIFARDVIHGFNTILPIPLGQAASWNPDLIQEGARISAIEARSSGIRWTFAPMIDITRDPRWGRIAECLGEDPFLTASLGAAMVKGFQGEDLTHDYSMVSCVKHFVAYGAAESGRDYHTVAVPENDLRDIYLPPFKRCIDSGALTLMSAFNEVNGIPATGNKMLTKTILRDEWEFDGFVVSDWSSVQQLETHGFVVDQKTAAEKAINAGIDMEMASTAYADYIKNLLEEKLISIETINEAVRSILVVKFKIGLFDKPYTNVSEYPKVLNQEHLAVTKELAKQSLVLLKNERSLLPLHPKNSKVAVIGPLADSPHDQLGTWIFDGNKKNSVTPLTAIREQLGDSKVLYSSGLEISRTMNKNGFKEAVRIAKRADVILLFIGEESILSGESHCRADINLPGEQESLIAELAKTGKPIIGIIMAGRPLTFESSLPYLDAVIYAWHPGTMAGPAISDILFGLESPSGKLPVSFPRVVGQIPIYYSQKNSGKPASDETWERMYEIPVEAPQLSIGNTNHFIDYGFEPLYPFGYGLSYSEFEYSDINISSDTYSLEDQITISVTLTNTGNSTATEVAQLYVRDLVGSRTRPVKELKGFQRVELKSGESKNLDFTLSTHELAFHNQEMKLVVEPGDFQAWVGGNSNATLKTEFTLLNQ